MCFFAWLAARETYLTDENSTEEDYICKLVLYQQQKKKKEKKKNVPAEVAKQRTEEERRTEEEERSWSREAEGRKVELERKREKRAVFVQNTK